MLELTDQAFARVQPLLPANSRYGKPWRDHRQVLGGIVWKLHTGRPWRDLPTRFGPWQSCYGRLRRWQQDGTWPRVWAVLAAGEHWSAHDRHGQASKALLAAVPVAATRAGLWRRRHHDHHSAAGPWVAATTQRGQQPARLSGRDPDQVRAGWLWRSWESARSAAPRARQGGMGADRRQEPKGGIAKVACRYQAS
jgi:transposase